MLKRDKRGQVTVFIIVAIVISVSVGLYFLLNNMNITEKNYPAEIDGLHSSIESCIKEASEEGILSVSESGGYFDAPKLSIESVPYYDYQGENKMPSKETVETEVSKFINKYVSSCSNELFNNSDLEITKGEVISSVKILSKEVVIKTNYPVNINKGKETYKFEKFDEVRIPVRLGTVYDAVSEYITEQVKYPANCITCFLNISEKYDLYIDMTEWEPNTTMFSFRDESSKLNDRTLYWVFANKYGA